MCAGSTSCGIKIFRFQVLYESLEAAHQKHILSQWRVSSCVLTVARLEDNVGYCGDEFFVFVYRHIFCCRQPVGHDRTWTSSLRFRLQAQQYQMSVRALVLILDPAGTYKNLGDAAKWILMLAMLIGQAGIVYRIGIIRTAFLAQLRFLFSWLNSFARILPLTAIAIENPFYQCLQYQHQYQSRQALKTDTSNVANARPNTIVIAIGNKNCACRLFSNINGIKPPMVVSEVNSTARNRSRLAPIAACFRLSRQIVGAHPRRDTRMIESLTRIPDRPKQADQRQNCQIDNPKPNGQIPRRQDQMG